MLTASFAVIALLVSAGSAVGLESESAATVAAAVTSDSLRGRVADSTGKPLADARVTLIELSRAAATDSAGAFVFTVGPADDLASVLRSGLRVGR